MVTTQLVPKSPIVLPYDSDSSFDEEITSVSSPTSSLNKKQPRSRTQELADFLATTGPELLIASPHAQEHSPKKLGRLFFKRQEKEREGGGTAGLAQKGVRTNGGKKYVPLVTPYSIGIDYGGDEQMVGRKRRDSSILAETIVRTTVSNFMPRALPTVDTSPLSIPEELNAELRMKTNLSVTDEAPTSESVAMDDAAIESRGQVLRAGQKNGEKMLGYYSEGESKSRERAREQAERQRRPEKIVKSPSISSQFTEEEPEPDRDTGAALGEEYIEYLEREIIAISKNDPGSPSQSYGIIVCRRHVQTQTEINVSHTPSQTQPPLSASEPPSDLTSGPRHSPGDLQKKLHAINHQLAAEKRARHRLIAAIRDSRDKFEALSAAAYRKIRELMGEREMLLREAGELRERCAKLEGLVLEQLQGHVRGQSTASGHKMVSVM
ncbi:uncharacterized protein VTP21DRAFT_6938 [Calcarisporiella thermophila]|uniref:uncharacterized protein n=1 Tax=Calcarisporiella thermophila TaxID=911321 RepID=UPI00374272BC